ncbi:MAG: ABC transporter substrate-binding protein [Flexistipes sinusarabici]|uniref:ABC transporter substrate-binding protein n=1 Tax=Flexistipes sinusarabici TaxID=2352 RepID=A0A5D0MJQ6_FLESI|nr:ABC transporter substrate-binding protein [Flexistipes sinusarabici]TYB32632.1 MAG: ABC transporter substrate-binding protein [Flexistipes sinusarabici]
MNKINGKMTIFEIVDQYPQTHDVFVNNGFPQFEDERKLKSAGKILKLESALKSKKYDVETYIKMLEDKIAETESNVDVTLKDTRKENADINITGLLPCPVRVPLMEKFDEFLENYQKKYDLKVDYKLEAASLGADFLKNILTVDRAEKLPDVFISAGFEAFFGKDSVERFKKNGVFKDLTDFELNDDFKGLDIIDKQGHYSVISVVPAVFMVNLQELGDLPIPQSWEDIFDEKYRQKVALPVGDFDLFNGILLNIYKDYGKEGVEKLGKSLMKSMHPSQMVKNAGRKIEEKPIITIMPYFFTKMLMDSQTMKVIWPSDGAIISPVFMLTKRNKEEELKPIADYLSSPEVGEILSHRGLFPSLNNEVDNNLAEDAPFKWLGWDYIYNNDIDALIKEVNTIFENSASEVTV